MVNRQLIHTKTQRYDDEMQRARQTQIGPSKQISGAGNILSRDSGSLFSIRRQRAFIALASLAMLALTFLVVRAAAADHVPAANGHEAYARVLEGKLTGDYAVERAVVARPTSRDPVASLESKLGVVEEAALVAPVISGEQLRLENLTWTVTEPATALARQSHWAANGNAGWRHYSLEEKLGRILNE